MNDVGAVKERPKLPGQVVLVLQGGGALGAYQGGVYQALHEAGIEPDWVVGTSIGAISGAIIAGNEVDKRLDRMKEFWGRLERKPQWHETLFGERAAATAAYLATLTQGINGYYSPNHAVAFGGLKARVGVERAAFYTIDDFRKTIADVVDFARVNNKQTRLTVGAVNVRTGKMHYFDNRDIPITLDHVLASGALPPGFPAIRIDGDPYWDGGLYSNSPIEVVFDDNPRRDSVVFSVQIFPITGPEPDSVMQVLSRQIDIQYASRADSHIPRQEHIHQLRHMVRELVRMLPEDKRNMPEVKEMAGYGCGTFMHIVRINANPPPNEDYLREIDFTTSGIGRRWRAGYEDTVRTLERRPWAAPVDPMVGVAVHDSDAPEQPSERANG
ncbi:MAG: patatin-like phospholipase family protein [Hyphomicrobiales bacterium]|nr:patatin-like phospholipase family protein [Hyphomicrobiales bacterium]